MSEKSQLQERFWVSIRQLNNLITWENRKSREVIVKEIVKLQKLNLTKKACGEK